MTSSHTPYSLITKARRDKEYYLTPILFDSYKKRANIVLMYAISYRWTFLAQVYIQIPIPIYWVFSTTIDNLEWYNSSSLAYPMYPVYRKLWSESREKRTTVTHTHKKECDQIVLRLKKNNIIHLSEYFTVEIIQNTLKLYLEINNLF